MATNYERIPVPSFTSPTATYNSIEILYSTAAFTQKGVTLAAGQGVLLAGTILGQKTADKKYYAYSNAAADGTQTARGVLRTSADTGDVNSGDQLGNIIIQGILKLGLIQGSDSAALTDLGATIDTVRGTFKL